MASKGKHSQQSSFRPLLTKASTVASNHILEDQTLCWFWVCFKTLGGGGNIAVFCLYQLLPKLVAVPATSLPLPSSPSPKRRRSVSSWPSPLPPPPQTQHTDQTLWRHLRPFSLRAPTVQLHTVLYFSCLQITTPGTQWIPGVCKFKVYDFCSSLLLRSTWIWTLYFYIRITITKRKKKN